MLRVACFFIIMSFSLSSLGAEDTLVFAIDVVRHGDRTPVIASSEMEKIWPQGPGQLTPAGMRQGYQLGEALRRQYVDREHLLPESFDTKTMYVRSSDFPRTLMTAQSILLGLYPLNSGPHGLPLGFQPVPIHTVPKEEDSLLVPDHDKASYAQWLQTYMASSPEWAQQEQALKPYFPSWSVALGVDIHHVFDLMKIGDRLFIEALYGLSLPQGLTQKDAEIIVEAGTWAWLNLVNHPKVASGFGCQLSETIIHEIRASTEKPRDLKYLLFVAHDSTIAFQLHLLGQHMDEIPPYASILHYGVYDRGGERYEVRVTYNNKPLVVKSCSSEACALNDFLAEMTCTQG